MPMALAASIWPRWMGALRRTGELLVVVIGSKFVIVSIISLAAGLVAENDGRVEHILAASALMLLACFAPFVLFKLVPFAEGAMTAAYGRRSAAGGAVSGVQIASDVQILRNMARSNWGESGATLWNAGREGRRQRADPSPAASRGGGGPGAGSGRRRRWRAGGAAGGEARLAELARAAAGGGARRPPLRRRRRPRHPSASQRGGTGRPAARQSSAERRARARAAGRSRAARRGNCQPRKPRTAEASPSAGEKPPTTGS